MIVLFTDFGLTGPYVGQMKARLLQEAPATTVLDLCHDLPPFDARSAAYLLDAYRGEFPAGAVFLSVVDPGVGSDRLALAVRADGQWFVGPDNGLLAIVARRSQNVRTWGITWRPAKLSASFHGRDLFAPIAAKLSREAAVESLAKPRAEPPAADWPDELPAVIYIDRFGNAMTGLRAGCLASGTSLRVADRTLAQARTFSEVSPGQAFWYENANGLAEIAVNQGHAGQELNLRPGTEVQVLATSRSSKVGRVSNGNEIV